MSPLLKGVDSKDAPAAFKALGIDLDLFEAGLSMHTQYERNKIELNVFKFLMYEQVKVPEIQINRKAVKRSAEQMKAAVMLSTTIDE